jgi:hypothetical protein
LCHHPEMEISRGDTKQLTLRVGDAERDACAAALIDHHLHGRLSVEELDRRQRAALAAVTTGDLGVLLADLPQGGPPVDRRSRRVVSAEASNAATKAMIRGLPVGVILAGASFAQWAWDYSATGPFLGALATGALGYASHAATVRWRR